MPSVVLIFILSFAPHQLPCLLSFLTSQVSLKIKWNFVTLHCEGSVLSLLAGRRGIRDAKSCPMSSSKFYLHCVNLQKRGKEELYTFIFLQKIL